MPYYQDLIDYIFIPVVTCQGLNLKIYACDDATFDQHYHGDPLTQSYLIPHLINNPHFLMETILILFSFKDLLGKSLVQESAVCLVSLEAVADLRQDLRRLITVRRHLQQVGNIYQDSVT